jgi:hypothetical protein
MLISLRGCRFRTQQIYPEKIIKMNMHVLSNDESFRKMMTQMSKRRLVHRASNFMFKEHLFISLVYIDYKLVNYLEERYPSFVIKDYDDKESMSISVASFLFKLNCRELRTLYLKFATKKDAIDDLMVYKNKDRCRFIARCWKWEVSHVELIDMVIAN